MGKVRNRKEESELEEFLALPLVLLFGDDAFLVELLVLADLLEPVVIALLYLHQSLLDEIGLRVVAALSLLDDPADLLAGERFLALVIVERHLVLTGPADETVLYLNLKKNDFLAADGAYVRHFLGFCPSPPPDEGGEFGGTICVVSPLLKFQ